jgi:hypothetical protein
MPQEVVRRTMMSKTPLMSLMESEELEVKECLVVGGGVLLCNTALIGYKVVLNAYAGCIDMGFVAVEMIVRNN